MIKILIQLADHVYHKLRSEQQRAVVDFSKLSESVGIGKDGTKTQRIDKIAEDAIIEWLTEKNLNWNLLSEECGYVQLGGSKNATAVATTTTTETIVVDPIDGTFNALARIPFFSVSLALGTRDLAGLKYAVVKNLVTGELYHAVKSEGAFYNYRRIHTRKYNPRNSLFSLYLGRKAKGYSYRLTKIARRIRALGSASLEICLVATGGIDLYYQSTQALRVTDVAAATLILREAGGEIYDLSTKQPLELEYELNTRVSILAVGDKAIINSHPEFLD